MTKRSAFHQSFRGFRVWSGHRGEQEEPVLKTFQASLYSFLEQGGEPALCDLKLLANRRQGPAETFRLQQQQQHTCDDVFKIFLHGEGLLGGLEGQGTPGLLLPSFLPLNIQLFRCPRWLKKAQGAQLDRCWPCTVPYEGDNFANSKMDNFSMIFKTSLKIIGIFYVDAKQGSKYIKVKKKLFKAKTTTYRKA